MSNFYKNLKSKLLKLNLIYFIKSLYIKNFKFTMEADTGEDPYVDYETLRPLTH